MKKFEIGKKYSTRSACNHDCIIEITVVARTAKTITVIDKHGEVQRLRISERISEGRMAETVYPWGRYSMAPIISAN